MKRIKGLFRIATLLIIPIVLLVSIGNASFAATDANDFYVMLYAKTTEQRPTGFYRVGTTGTTKPVIKLVKTNSGGTTNNSTDVIYCLDNEKGFGTGSGSSAINYKVYYDMRSPESIDSTYKLSNIFSNSNYKSLMWLLDNIAVDSSSKNILSEKLESAKGFTLDELQDYTMQISDKSAQATDILEVVQQAAIWRLLKSDGAFRPTNPTDFYWTKDRNESIVNHSLDSNYYDELTGGAAKALYEYLITTAQNNSSYDFTKVGTTPLTYVKGFTTSTAPTVKINGTNYIIGPYNITNRAESNLTNLDVTLTTGAKLVNASGNDLSGSTNEAKIQSSFGTDFYISIPVKDAPSTITFTVKPTFGTRKLQYRIPASSVSTSQPIVVIQNTTDSETETSTVTLTQPTFDLALRKFITSVRDSEGNNKSIDSRTPTIDVSTLSATGAEKTTATYKHRKDPVTVETGDIVEYTLRVYNEGEAAGRATQITDQLPTGLKFKSVVGDIYEASYTESTNRLVLNRKTSNTTDLAGYTSGTPKYEDVVIECEVTATPGTSNKVLTNVAWVSTEVNAVTTETITNQSGKDRDSIPATTPSVNKDNMAEYTGNGNKSDLADSNNYYKGQEDDDDFEKLILKPAEDVFDLALRKYISKIEDSSGNVKSQNVRTLEVNETPLKSAGTTAEYKHAKNPVAVETGDTVYYNLRIYNEGEAEGRATKIVDQLPTGVVLDETKEITGNFEKKSYSDNKIVLQRKAGNTSNLPAYTENSLQEGGSGYETITIPCKVTAVADANNDKVLTNIAWISEEYNAKTNETIITETGKDRDSVPATAPTYNNDWKGMTSESDLSKQIYYPGQEDDDDFEKIVLKPKYFDLALRKFISEVKDSSGAAKTITTSRVPQIQSTEKQKLGTGTATFDNGITTEKTHTKDALEVNTGDIVTYTIRVYNEGQVDGWASEITDYIPSGLEFVTGSTNNAAWNYDLATRKATTKNEIKLNAYNKTTNTLDYKDVKIDCRVTAIKIDGNNLKNVAEITQKRNTLNLPDKDSPNALTDTQKSNYNPDTAPHGKGYEDDDDYENLKLPDLYFDLALRKFITEIKDSDGNQRTIDSREPNITAANIRDLANGNTSGTHDTGRTAIKSHKKDALTVSKGDKVKYTIRIYNEGNVNGTATKVTDYLPEGLKLVENSDTNKKYGWAAESSDTTGRTVTTTYLSSKTIAAFNGSRLEYEDVEIECEVIGDDITSKNLKNVAEITEFKNDANITTDRDSKVSNVSQKGDRYNVLTSTQGKGYEDDDDFEDLLLIRFDLALRKFITGVNEEKITNRVPAVDTSKLGTTGADGKEITSFTYTHTKDPVKVEQNNTVIYTIRVYNEGNVDGYAEVIKDDIPEGLEYLPDHEINKKYGWTLLDESGKTTTDVTKAKYITTDYRSRAKSTTENLIKAYNKNTMQTPDYKDVEVAFKVTEPNTSDRIITNKAQISKHSDKDGNTNVKDKDSTPDVWNEGEDDQDVEHIYVKYFDLALRKWVTHAIVIEDGVQKEMATGHKAEDDPESVVKVEINKKRLENTVVKFRYSIRITNEGEITGAATEISDYIPKGLKFNQADNPKWRESNGKVITDQLKDTMLQPGESATVDILLTWENSESNMGVMVNVAEISADYNESGTPDIDSTPNNKKEKEDDIDDAPVALTVVAGSAPTYIAIASGIALIIGAGVFFIKKYVI